MMSHHRCLVPHLGMADDGWGGPKIHGHNIAIKIRHLPHHLSQLTENNGDIQFNVIHKTQQQQQQQQNNDKKKKKNNNKRQ